MKSPKSFLEKKLINSWRSRKRNVYFSKKESQHFFGGNLTPLKEIQISSIEITGKIKDLYQSVKNVNTELWDIEDKLRISEKNQNFDKNFIELARGVYFANDKRAALSLVFFWCVLLYYFCCKLFSAFIVFTFILLCFAASAHVRRSAFICAGHSYLIMPRGYGWSKQEALNVSGTAKH